MNPLGPTKIVAQSATTITIEKTVLKKLSPLLDEIRITLPRVEMHIKQLEGER